MAVKSLSELMEPFLKNYKGSYNDRMFAWLQAGAPGWNEVIDPNNDGTPGGPAAGGGTLPSELADINKLGLVRGIFLNSINDLPAGTPANSLVIVRGNPPAPVGIPPQIMGTPTLAGPGISPDTSVDIPVPAGVQAGEVLIVALRAQSQSGVAPGWQASGWTMLSPDFAAGSAARILSVLALRVTQAMVTNGLPSAVTFSSGAGTAGRKVGTMFRVAGVHPTTLLAGRSTSYAGSAIANGVSVIPYAITGPALQLTITGNENTSPNATDPATVTAGHVELAKGSTQLPNTETRTSVHVLGKAYTSAGDTDSVSVTYAAANGAGGHSVALLGTVN